MKITRDAHARRYLLDRMRQTLGAGTREGIHISDLLSPMRCYWSKVKPKLPTDSEVLYFTAGQGHEGVLLRLMQAEHMPDGQWEGIWYSPDTLLFARPAEVKTRRVKTKLDPKEDVQGYIEQHKSYCVSMNVTSGYIVVLYLMTKADDFTTKPDLFVYYVEYEDAELQAKAIEMTDMYNRLDAAIMLKDRSDIPYCEEWKCGKKIRTKISVGYCEDCGVELTARQINTHLRKGCQRVRHPQYKETIKKSCRWFDICKPPYFGGIDEHVQDIESPGGDDQVIAAHS